HHAVVVLQQCKVGRIILQCKHNQANNLQGLVLQQSKVDRIIHRCKRNLIKAIPTEIIRGASYALGAQWGLL
ncbi:MAG: hypothetical protein Q8K36_07060, partial [Alphaproteobacteria bacterium]|nr:hypothetical protein [Alphaproteobacteria bacterium]